MFRNNNKTIVKHLAKNSLRSDKTNRRFTILTIAISVCLMFSISLIMLGTDQLHKNTQIGKAQISIIGATEKQLDKLKKQSKVEWIGETAALGYSYQKDITLNIVYADKTQITNQLKYSYTGSFPKDKNEVMLPENYLNYLHSKAKPGDIISLDLTGNGQKQDYKISGIIALNKKSDSYLVWVSKDMAKTLSKDNIFSVTAYTRLRTDAINSSQITDFAHKVIESTGIKKSQVMLTDYFAVMNALDRQGMLPYVVLFSFIILILAGIIIYGIFYSSVTKNVQSYGQLRTIGMTKKQVKKMVRKKGVNLALRGIPLGLLIGLIIGYTVCPHGFQMKNTIISAVIISVFAFFMVRVSMHTPVKLAAGTSPLAGLCYLPYKGKQKYKNNKKHHRITSERLAWMNLKRNRKKTIFTLGMFSLSGILLITTSTLSQSMSAEKKARFMYFPNGEIRLNIQRIAQSTFSKEAKNDPYRDTRLQLESNPLSNSKLLSQITKVDGVKKITPSNAVKLCITYNGTFGTTTIIANNYPTISRKQCKKINSILLSGTADYDMLTKKNGILISNSDAKIGDVYKINGRSSDGRKFEIKAPVMGTYAAGDLMEKCPVTPGSPYFLMTYDSIRKLTGVIDQTGCLTISVEPNKLKKVTKEIKTIADQNNKIDMYTLAENVRNIQVRFDQYIKALYFISVILFTFGIISLVNIVITSIALRKQEFGLLQAVGMTAEQINQMLQTETLFYTGGSFLLSTVGGFIIGGIVCNKLENTSHCIIYHYPWIVILVLAGVLLLIQFVLSFYSTRSLKKTTILERIRATE
ncbi:FtsX-like permease family protein [Haloimpatiens sp. FM7330]|uniref:ABC transporter permease n=1 Tax=Haloimpatiens sp. FM7330 TaxID=3298610 RepID=UPI003630894A